MSSESDTCWFIFFRVQSRVLISYKPIKRWHTIHWIGVTTVQLGPTSKWIRILGTSLEAKWKKMLYYIWRTLLVSLCVTDSGYTWHSDEMWIPIGCCQRSFRVYRKMYVYAFSEFSEKWYACDAYSINELDSVTYACGAVSVHMHLTGRLVGWLSSCVHLLYIRCTYHGSLRCRGRQ